MQTNGRGRLNGRCGIPALFLVEYALGHRTHARFLDRHLACDPRFDATLIRLDPKIPQWVALVAGKLQVPILHRYGADFSTWWVFQYKLLQARRALRGLDLSRYGFLYIHTQTAAAVILELPVHIPTVVSIDLTWKLVFEGESRYAPSPLFAPIYRLEHRIYERADLIVSFSDWAAASLVADYGISPEKVRVVRNGVTLPNGHGNGHGHENGHGNGHGVLTGPANGQLHLGFIGNELTRKGGDLLLRTHQEQFADMVHLTLVTRESVRRRNLLRNVTLRHEVPWEELMTTVLPQFDLFVFPTRYDYSPYAVIEAMTAGVPVIASRVGAIPEMIQDGVNGFLIAPDRAEPLAGRIAWALANRDQLPLMGDQARHHAAQTYAADQNYPQLLDLLAGLDGAYA